MELKPDPANPNRMSAADKERMAKSLAEFGDLSGITINRKTGLLIGGHQRCDVLAGAKLTVTDLKTTDPDGTVARGTLERDGRKFAVRVVDWSESKAHAALLAANRFGRVGQDDNAALKDLLESIDTGEFDMDLTGFCQAELERLMTQVYLGDDKTKEPPASVKSSVYFPPRVWLTQRGQIIADIEAVIKGYGGEAEWAE